MGKERPTEESDRAKEPYCQAARFAAEADAGQVYFQAQNAIFQAPANDLSAYRLQLNLIWHVAVVGEPPPRRLDRQIRRILAAGDLTSLPSDILTLLLQRRASATKQSSWVEKHQWPGEHL